VPPVRKGPIGPFQNLLAPALFGCFREKTRFISKVRAPSAGATGNFGRGLWGERRMSSVGVGGMGKCCVKVCGEGSIE
jgi:hypothetical protein